MSRELVGRRVLTPETAKAGESLRRYESILPGKLKRKVQTSQRCLDFLGAADEALTAY